MKVINLLSKEKQREFVYRRIFRSLLRLFALACFGFIIVGLFQFGSKLYIDRTLQNLYAELERIKAVSNKEENTLLKAKIQNINNYINDFNNLAKDTPKWSNAIREFAVLVPENVYIQSFVVDIAKQQAQITGFALRRESVIELYERISRKTEHFANIDYPLENVSRPTNVQFHFTFMVQEAVLK